MANPEVKIRGGVVGARRILAAIDAADEIQEVRDCLKELFLYELANEMRGSNRFKPEFEKRIDRLSQNAERSMKKAEQ